MKNLPHDINSYDRFFTSIIQRNDSRQANPATSLIANEPRVTRPLYCSAKSEISIISLIAHRQKGCPARSGITRQGSGKLLIRLPGSARNRMGHSLFQIRYSEIQMGHLLLRLRLLRIHWRLIQRIALKRDSRIGPLRYARRTDACPFLIMIGYSPLE